MVAYTALIVAIVKTAVIIIQINRIAILEVVILLMMTVKMLIATVIPCKMIATDHKTGTVLTLTIEMEEVVPKMIV